MKRYLIIGFILLLVILIAVRVRANDYYFSALGSDANSGSITAPFKTLAKANSLNLAAGDNVFFHGGEIFYGSLVVSHAGTTAKPITYTSYGSGKAIISGLQTLTNWTSIGGGKYEASANLGTAISIVTINDVQQEMGRYPNSSDANGGYLSLESHTANTSITDLQSTGNWTGAELVVRTNRYIIDRTKIISHAGTVISYSPALTYVAGDGYGYFIQNDIRTLDKLGEWYYNPTTKKLTVYFGTANPDAYSVKASGIDNVVYDRDFDNITFDNLTITGGDIYSVFTYSASNISIRNCDISFSGVDGININNATNVKVENCTVKSSNNIGINLNNSVNGIYRNNVITQTALIKGLGQNSANRSIGIRETGNNNLIEYNTIDSVGYMGIRFGGDNANIKNNLVNHFTLTKDDGGGIYTSNAGTGRKIVGNIVLNGIGAAFGTNSPVAGSTSGIYIDDFSTGVQVLDNIVANCNRAGIFLHNCTNITATGNTLFNNNSTQFLESHNMTNVNAQPIRNVVFKNNTLFAKTASQLCMQVITVNNDVALMAGDMDNNILSRPLDDNFVIKTQSVNDAGKTILQDLDLGLWRKNYSKDLHSTTTATSIISHKVNALIGSNKFFNGNFNINILGLTFGTSGSSAKRAWVNKIDGGTYQVTIASTKPGLTTTTIPIGFVTPSKKYVIGFTVENSKDTLMYVYARQTLSPYKVLSNNGAKTILRIDPNRKDYELAFSPTIENNFTSIFFENPAQQSTWWLDNIRVHEADVTITNPDDSIRFEYNASQSDKTIGLSGIQVDAKGNIYNGTITLAPYTGLALINKSGQITPPPVNQPPIVTLTSPVNNAIYTNPNPVILSATATDSDGTISKVEFYDGSKLILTEYNRPYIMAWQNPPVGSHTVLAKAYDNSGNISTSTPATITVNAALTLILQLNLQNLQ